MTGNSRRCRNVLVTDLPARTMSRGRCEFWMFVERNPEMSTRFPVASLFLLGLILAAFAGCTALPPAMPDGAVASPAPAGDAAAETNGTAAGNMQQLLARQLGLPEADVRIVSVEPMEWPDACLGAGGPAESCALVVTPGYKLTFEVRRRDLRLPHRPLRLPVPAGCGPRTRDRRDDSRLDRAGGGRFVPRGGLRYGRVGVRPLRRKAPGHKLREADAAGRAGGFRGPVCLF